MKSKTPLIIIIAVVATAGIMLAVMSMGLLSSGKNAKEPEPPKEYTFSVGDFTDNLSETGYKRYIMVSLSVGYTEQTLEAELTEKLPQISDTINSVLRSKKIDDIDTPEKTDIIKKEMMDRINGLLSKGKLVNIYFNKILIQ